MMIIKFFVYIYIFFMPLSYVIALDVGTGSEFEMISNGQKVDLSIYIAEKKETQLSVEFHFGTGSLFLPNMWQRFEFSRTTGAISVKKGYIKLNQNERPQIMSKENFEVNRGGVQLNDFLFSDQAKLNKNFIKDEVIETKAGFVIAKRYKQSSGSQTIEYWISSEVRPIGLVKLISKDKKVASNNYSIELKSLLKGVKAAIDPDQAVPLKGSTKSLLNRAQ